MIFIITACALTAIMLIAGVTIMAFGGRLNNKVNTKLMIGRVIFQFIAITLMISFSLMRLKK